MENRREELLKTVCRVYMAAILVVLPLYYIPWNGYYKLGDTKYYLYRNISLICVGIWLLMKLTAAVSKWWFGENDEFGDILHGAGKRLFRTCREHAVTTAVCLYGGCAVISALFSPYGATAWTGEREWYMGAVTICLMVSGFIMAADYGRQCKQVLLLGEVAFVVITLLGLLQKFGYDPLRLLKGYVVGDWEFTHMVSTLGNNNWLSGYYSAMLPLSLMFFQRAVLEKKRILTFLSGAGNVFAFMLLLLQGSAGGVLVASTALGLCFWMDRKKGEIFDKLLLLMAAVSVGMNVWGKWMKHLGTYDILLQDGIAKKLAAWRWWIPSALLILLFYGIYHLTPKEKKKILRIGLLYSGLGIGVMIVLKGLNSLNGINLTEWGNRRGRLWQMSWEGFCKGSLQQKLLGAGPDCFAGYLGELLPGGTVLFDQGYFAGSVFTNAHNEWLTTLINMGIMGVASYAGIFVTALWKYRKDSFGILLLCTYGIHSLISFQQVLNAPLFFLLLGICEAIAREKMIE